LIKRSEIEADITFFQQVANFRQVTTEVQSNGTPPDKPEVPG
jgi:hypothetical protein